MDHETALRAANQALGGRAPRGVRRFSSVELRGVEEIRVASREERGEEGSAVPSGAWELTAMICVGVGALLVVLVAWLW
jgi:hypothetical protein